MMHDKLMQRHMLPDAQLLGVRKGNLHHICLTMHSGKRRDTTHLPEGFEVVLEQLCPNQVSRPGQRAARTGRTKPKAEPARSPKRGRTKSAKYALSTRLSLRLRSLCFFS